MSRPIAAIDSFEADRTSYEEFESTRAQAHVNFFAEELRNLRPLVARMLEFDRNKLHKWISGKEDMLHAKLMEIQANMGGRGDEKLRQNTECGTESPVSVNHRIMSIRDFKIADEFARFLLEMNGTNTGVEGALFS